MSRAETIWISLYSDLSVQVWKILAICNFPLRDPSRPRATGIGVIAARDVVEPRCLPSTTRFPRDVIFPPTNLFLAGLKEVGRAIRPAELAPRNPPPTSHAARRTRVARALGKRIPARAGLRTPLAPIL